MQALQLRHGGAEPRLRTPRIHEALAALAHVGALEPSEARGLAESYRFFRLLINGLRMLRGSARDLLLPPEGDDELLHLARRMGYGPAPGLDPARALALDVETHTASVRAFLERRFGRGRGARARPGRRRRPGALGRGERGRRPRRSWCAAASATRHGRYANLRSLAGAGDADRVAARPSPGSPCSPATCSPACPTPTWR